MILKKSKNTYRQKVIEVFKRYDKLKFIPILKIFNVSSIKICNKSWIITCEKYDNHPTFQGE